MKRVGPWLAAGLLALSACRPTGFYDAMAVFIELEEGTGLRCVRLSAQSLVTNRIGEVDVQLGDRRSVRVGISEEPDFTGELRLTLSAFTSEDCSGRPVATQTRTAALSQPPIVPVVFRFGRPDGGLPMPDAGQPDGGSPDAAVPDAGAPDAGAEDAGQPDAGTDGGACELSTCQSSACATALCTATGCTQTPEAARTPCDGGLCNGAGACVACLQGDACDAGRPCARQGVCSAVGTCEPTFAECNTTNPCLRPLLQCASDGGCSFRQEPPGATCDAGAVCYANAQCRPQLRASNVNPALAPYPAVALTFATNCVYAYDTTGAGAPVPVGMAGVTCTWPTPPPVLLSQGAGGVDVLAFSGTSLSVEPGALVRFVGQRPAVLLIHGEVTIRGRIDLRALGSAFRGAGADSPACGRGLAGQAAEREGGGGGGFRDDGGSGGRALSPSGGLANGNDDLVPLRGGCSGGLGWLGIDGGFGAGALQISAAGAFALLDGGLGASGLGGLGGIDGGGGGGGGSGGAFLIQAASITVLNSTITANGGGGGEGGTRENMTRTNGRPGLAGAFSTAVPADGGTNGNCCGGNGGFGGAGDTAPVNGTNGGTGSSGPVDLPGGGGGGGSRGRIRFDTARSTDLCDIVSSTISPDDQLQSSNTACRFQ
ncbi:MAG: hypothetical protein SFW67_21495 [Myxococcaceae bacterium]|nr:hypothetical protein [Myxococcaceae bacterium]